MYAKRIDRIQPSATLEMTAKASELRQKGIDVMNLSVGEPDFNTPNNIQKAAIKAMEDGFTKYTPGPGLLDLRKAICEKLYRDNKLNYSPNEIIVSCGGKHSLYNACQVLFEKGDEVIIFSPYWVSFPDFVSITGATPIFVNTNPTKQFEPIFSDLNDKINKNTKGIIINSPSNPTGGVWSNAAIEKVLDIAQRNDIWVFSDECYEQLTYENKFISPATLVDNNEKILTFQSCSKTYSMTGWRIGYTAGNKDLIKAMSKLQGQSTSCPNSIAQVAAIEALLGDQSMVYTMKDAFHKRRNLITKLLNKIEGLSCIKPGGAFYVFPDFEYYINNSKIKTSSELSMYLLEEEALVTVAGDCFGSPNNIRFSYALSENNIIESMKRLERALKKLLF